ncbi:MAG: hypothetical protein LUC25_04505 [Ruminococcus sp.]|nr:hypothetical protein [Ruminococcus sp.]
MKKLLSIILALTLAASFAACDSDDDSSVKMPDVSSESEALTYEEAIEPFVASEEIQTLQQKANELYDHLECIIAYYCGWSPYSATDDNGVTITTEDGISDDLKVIEDYIDSCDQYVTTASGLSNAMVRDAYISFSDTTREMYSSLADRNGEISSDEGTIEEALSLTKLGLYNMVLQSAAVDESRASDYLHDYVYAVQQLFTVAEAYCMLSTEEAIANTTMGLDSTSFSSRALSLMDSYLSAVNLSNDASGIDISYITTTINSFLVYQPNAEAMLAEAYEGDSQKQAQLEDFFEQATKLYNTLVATPPSFGDESYITKNEFDVDSLGASNF